MTELTYFMTVVLTKRLRNVVGEFVNRFHYIFSPCRKPITDLVIVMLELMTANTQTLKKGECS